MKKTLTVLAVLCLMTLTGCYSLDDIHPHYNAHIGGYIGTVDVESQSLPGLDGYSNISEYYHPQHPDYSYFVKKYIFESWRNDGPSGKAQFWSDNQSDWIDEILPGNDGKREERPFTKDIVVENGRMYLNGVSWQKPWSSWSWLIHSASSSEIVLVSEKDNYYFRIKKGDAIEAAEAYDGKSNADRDREKGFGE
ncbi:MAG: hypothetical protein Q4G10_08485 [Bacteroidia bacterium]|nr:hypothetical protein [Bacteroidia bacterium]